MNPVRSAAPRRLLLPYLPLVYSATISGRKLVALNSELTDGSFYSAAGSLTGLTPAMDPAPVLASSFFHAGPFAAATPHRWIGDNRGGFAYRFTTCRDYDYAVQDGHFGVQMHHPRFLEWVGAPESARLLSVFDDVDSQRPRSVCSLSPWDGVGDARIGSWSS